MIRALVYRLAAGPASTVVDDTSVRIAGIAAGVAGAIYLTKTVFVPFSRLIHKSLMAWKVLEGLPERMNGVDGRLDGVDDRLEALERLTAVAKETAVSVMRDLGTEHRQPPT